MIKYRTPINFLRHIYSDSIPDVANILNAEAEDDYDTIIGYLQSCLFAINGWIDKLKKMKDEKEDEK